MAELLDGISEIDWSALKHEYGSAKDVPAWLAAMTDPDTSAAALDKLDTAVYHQGGMVNDAGAAVLPFLIRFALEPAVAHRADILELVARFACLDREMSERLRFTPAARRCRATLLGAFDSLVGLLDDPDPAVRRRVVEALVALTERAGDLAGELMRRLPGEADPDVAADYVLALAATAKSTSTATESSNSTATEELTSTTAEDSTSTATGDSPSTATGESTGIAAWLSDRTPPVGDPRRLVFLVAGRRLGHHAATAGDLLAAYPYAVPQREVGWLGREVGADREARIALARIAIAEAVRTRQDQPLAEAGVVMHRWRSATAALVPDIGATLDGPSEIRASAVHLLAASGDAGRAWADRLAEPAGRPDRTGTLAAWALARQGDRRAVPVVERSLRRDPEVFPMGSGHYTDGFYWLTQDPGIADVCLPLVAYADELVPAIRWRLRHDDRTPTAYQLSEVLTAYGSAAAAAVPELTALLGTDRSAPACKALAALGPAAESALSRLTQVASASGRDAGPAAWAIFRITGDPEPFLARDDVLNNGRITAATARMLGDLGPAATRYRPDIERQTAGRPNFWPTWDGVELGFAHYRITGDPELCLKVFDAALDPLRHSRQLPVSRQVLRYLPALGKAAAGFTPLLRHAVEQDERLLYSGGWRGLAEDDEARDLAKQALDICSQ